MRITTEGAHSEIRFGYVTRELVIRPSIFQFSTPAHYPYKEIIVEYFVTANRLYVIDPMLHNTKRLPYCTTPSSM